MNRSAYLRLNLGKTQTVAKIDPHRRLEQSIRLIENLALIRKECLENNLPECTLTPTRLQVLPPPRLGKQRPKRKLHHCLTMNNKKAWQRASGEALTGKRENNNSEDKAASTADSDGEHVII